MCLKIYTDFENLDTFHPVCPNFQARPRKTDHVFRSMDFVLSAPGQQDGRYLLSRRDLIPSALFALWVED